MPPDLASRRYRLGLSLFTHSARCFGAIIIAVAVLALLVPLVVAQFRSIEISAWFHAANVGKVLTAVVAGGYVYTLVPTAIAQGLTRRELSTAIGVFGVLWSLGLAAVGAAGLALEHVYYGALDWTHAIDQQSGPAALDSVADALAHGLTYPLAYLVYFTGGALIGAVIYRSEAGWIALAPIIPTVLVLDSMVSGGEPWGPGWLVAAVTGHTAGWDNTVTVPIALVLVALGARITHRTLLGAAVRSKQA